MRLARLLILIWLLTVVSRGICDAQQPIPIIHPSGGGGGGGMSAVVTDNLTLSGNGASAANPLKVTGSGLSVGIGGSAKNKCGADNVCNVINFGADPTSTNDSTPAIQAAQTAADAAPFIRSIYIPAGTYKLGFPYWINGSPDEVIGAGGLSHSTVLTGNYVVVMPKASFAFNAGCGAGIMWTTPLAGSTGQTMCDNESWWIELKQLITSGNGGYSKDQPLAQAQLDAQFWFNGTSGFSTGGQMLIESDGSDGSVAIQPGPLALSYTSNGTSGTMTAQLRVGGTLKTANTASIATFAGTTHFYEVSYDGSNIRWFVDGTQSGSNVAATGTVTDQPYYNLALGSGEPWPTRSAATGFHGQLFGLRISKIARNTTNYSAPTSAFTTCDSNTIILLNGTTVNSAEGVSSVKGPFVQPECILGQTSGNWYLMHDSELESNVTVTLRGFAIRNIQTAGYGLVINQSASNIGDDLYMELINGVGFVEENNSYYSGWSNFTVNNAIWGAEFLWPSQICNNCTFFGSDYPVVDNGGVIYNQGFITPVSTTRACSVSNGGINPFVQEKMTAFNCDNEGQFTGVLSSFNGGNTLIDSSVMIGGNPSAISVHNANITLNNDLIVGSTSELMSAGYGSTNEAGSLTTFNSTLLGFNYAMLNPTPVTDGQGEQFEFHGMGAAQVTGTTAGTASLSCPTYTDQTKTCYVHLVGYKNASTTAQLIMMPAGVTTMSPPIVTTGLSCSGVSFGTGSNAGCVSNANPYPCCTGSAAGTCNTNQFVTLPANMSTAQTVNCETIGD